MDKAEFVRRAPGYYVAAIAYALEGIPFPFTREKLSERLGGNSSLGNDIIFDAAIRELRRIGVVEVQSDDFAPTLYQGGSTFDDWWRSDEAGKQFPIIGRLHGIFPDDRRDWLREALGSLNQKAWTFSLKPEDFENDPPDEWEPIPIDRRDSTFQAVEAALEKAIGEIEGSNGYASTAPQERNYVVAQLTRLRDILKTEVQVQWMVIKTFALEPLAMVAKRFGTAGVGLAAVAASQAIQDWLKKVAAKAFEWLSSP